VMLINRNPLVLVGRKTLEPSTLRDLVATGALKAYGVTSKEKLAEFPTADSFPVTFGPKLDVVSFSLLNVNIVVADDLPPARDLAVHQRARRRRRALVRRENRYIFRCPDLDKRRIGHCVCNALLSVPTIESGVPAGANIACQYSTSSLGPNVTGKLSAVGNSASFSFEVTP